MNKFINKLKEFDSKIAIVHDNIETSYKELFKSIHNYLKLLEEKKVLNGSIVAIKGDYSKDCIALFLACYLNNNIIVPLTETGKDDISLKLSEAKVDILIEFENEIAVFSEINSDKNKHEIIKNLVNLNEPGLILFSSGSTGKPKAMIHNLANLINSYINKREKNISLLILLMYDHIGGINTLLNSLAMGSKLVIPSKREPNEICKLIEEHKIKILPASPTFLNLILISKAYKTYNLSSLRMITYGTEPMPESLLIKIKNEFPKVKLLQTFGTSETGIASTQSMSSNSTFMKIDDPNLEYKIVENELWLKSKTQVLGYLNSSMESFTDDGWFKTGDLVELGENGYLKIIGRNKEVINVGGQKVLPSEIESVLLEIEEIEDCTAFSEKNNITGQNVAVKVKVKTQMSNREAKRLIRNYCKNKMENYKIPTTVIVQDEMEVGSRFKKNRLQ